jgi:hypothetical protein
MDFELMDGDGDPVLDYENKTQKNYRVEATISTAMDIHRCPFDSFTLPILIEMKGLSTKVVVLTPWTPSGLVEVDPDVQVAAGWTLQAADRQSFVRTHHYQFFATPLRAASNNYSRYTFAVLVTRTGAYGWFRGIIPPLLIVLGGFLSFLLIKEEHVVAMLAVNTSALVSAVLYDTTLTAAIPATGYLTYIDIFMVINYAALIASLLSTVALLLIADKHKRRFNRLCGLSTIGAWVVLQLLLAKIYFW